MNYCCKCHCTLLARGCLTCNEWSDSAGNPVKLSVEDLAAPACAAEKVKGRRLKPTPLRFCSTI